MARMVRQRFRNWSSPVQGLCPCTSQTARCLSKVHGPILFFQVATSMYPVRDPFHSLDYASWEWLLALLLTHHRPVISQIHLSRDGGRHGITAASEASLKYTNFTFVAGPSSSP